MAFARTQLRLLNRRLSPKWIKHRESNGQTLSYIEGWHAVAEANRVFGFDGWDRETIASQCVWAKPIGTKYGAAYLTRVRITVRAGDQRVVREGSGTGEATAASPGAAHEIAAKGAETDATKRALSTFGNLFGLSLYGGNSEPNTPASPQRFSNGQFRRAAGAATQSPIAETIEPSKNSLSDAGARHPRGPILIHSRRLLPAPQRAHGSTKASYFAARSSGFETPATCAMSLVLPAWSAGESLAMLIIFDLRNREH